MFSSRANPACVDFKDAFVAFAGWCRDTKSAGASDVTTKMFYCAWKLNEVRKSPDLIPEDTSRRDFHSSLALDSQSALLIRPRHELRRPSAVAATAASGVLCLENPWVLCMVR